MNSLTLALLTLLFAAPLFAEEPINSQAAWEEVLALDAGPQAPITSRDAAQSVSLEYLARQDAALRHFLKTYPNDPHAVDAQLRLAHLLTTQSDLIGNPAPHEAALRLLADALKTAPAPRRADLAFARIALSMHRITIPTDADRDAITTQMLWFQTNYPNDRRVAALMVEIASLFDARPKQKEKLLKQAFQAASTDDLRARITDDLRRLDFLGQPVSVRGTTADGVPVDSAQLRGKVILVYFFASWSAPSIAAMDEVDYLRKTSPEDQLAVIGVSLDANRAPLDDLIKSRGMTWPVIFDGKGWRSPLVRGLAINAVPTLWMLDRKGHLRTLNARTDSEALMRVLLKEK